MTSNNGGRLGRVSVLSRRLLASLVGLLASLASIVSGAGPASAQNVVGPQPVMSILTVGPHATAGQEIVGVRGPPLRQQALATGVAADTEATAGERVAASCGGGSFSPDTQVVMADGSMKPLDRVKVEATDTATGKTSAQTVTTLWVNHDTDLMDVTVTADGTTSTIHTTQHHLFWIPAKNSWVEADQLVAGDQLRTDHGSTATVAGTVEVPGVGDMWDLTVNNDHDFYVVTTSANVLVHNNCGWNAGTALPSGEKAGVVGNRIWGHGLPDASRLDGLANVQLRGIASRADAVQLQQWYDGAATADKGGGTAGIRVGLTQKIIDAWDAG